MCTMRRLVPDRDSVNRHRRRDALARQPTPMADTVMKQNSSGSAVTNAATRRCARMRIRVTGGDRPGLVATLTGVLHEQGGNIRESSQFSTDPDDGAFFLRMVVDVSHDTVDAFSERVRQVVAELGMTCELRSADRRKRMVVLCSTGDHCVLDLLWRTQTDDLHADVPLVVSNHDKLRTPVEQFDVPFYYVPADPTDRSRSERRILDLIGSADADVVVLARYMQILSEDFLQHLGVPVINIHHSLLPAFVGAQPYRRAYERGVKIIGATAHYATPELDAGPIIAQGVENVGHTADAAAMAKLGRNVEQTVLARAVRLHVDDRVQVHRNRTIIHV
ncbi:formyltetrahydrofolate deformylase [Sciscionella marina]|uniref:formyltetrahydrofolate deformylase n=1 Tax=Sciscionella marina TaxID=508770 RepID=UPI001F09FE84|nr:formyltetrahydrofolate deformylase [Sciscionella marina]